MGNCKFYVFFDQKTNQVDGVTAINKKYADIPKIDKGFEHYNKVCQKYKQGSTVYPVYQMIQTVSNPNDPGNRYPSLLGGVQ